MSNTLYDEFQQTLESQGADRALSGLADRLREAGRFHELFDTRLMQARRRLGLPTILTENLDQLEEPLRGQVEQAYLDACREVGQLLLDAGRLGDAWRYWRITGDKAPVAEALERTAIAEDNLDEILEIALQEGVHPEFGFGLVLEHYGTCNAITLFDSQMQSRTRAEQQHIAGLLVRHLHGELLANLRADIEQRESQAPDSDRLSELLTSRDELLANDNYHIDTSHLGAVVRFARLCEDHETLRLAADLTEYGRRLSATYQYQGEEPFADVYPSHRLFFLAQLGEEVDEALDYFRQKAADLSPEEHGGGPAEVYVALLARLRREAEAIEAATKLLPAGTPTSGFAPSLLELARRAGGYDRLMAVSRDRDDVLGYVAGAIEAAELQSDGS
mgnify:CR=1 FL=1